MSELVSKAISGFAPFMRQVPIDVSACSNAVGLDVFVTELPEGISGMIVKGNSNSGFVCYVDKNEPSVRQRFTAAHELGHFMLHRHMIGDGLKDSYLLRAEGLTNSQESEANRFAADLLMPRDLIADAMKNGTTTVSGLASLFKVSEVAMSIRLGLKT
jgi:Zn-dependent peptidase ImmA (M78 family)